MRPLHTVLSRVFASLAFSALVAADAGALSFTVLSVHQTSVGGASTDVSTGSAGEITGAARLRTNVSQGSAFSSSQIIIDFHAENDGDPFTIYIGLDAEAAVELPGSIFFETALVRMSPTMEALASFQYPVDEEGDIVFVTEDQDLSVGILEGGIFRLVHTVSVVGEVLSGSSTFGTAVGVIPEPTGATLFGIGWLVVASVCRKRAAA